MKTLKIEIICDFDQLVSIIAEGLRKTHGECERQAWREGAFPENEPIYFDARWPERDEKRWFRIAVDLLMKEMNLQSLYVFHIGQ